MKKTDTRTLAAAMAILARDIQSGDGVANAAIHEAGLRLNELQDEVEELRLYAECDHDWKWHATGAGMGYICQSCGAYKRP